MEREYQKWYSPALAKHMELLIFGHAGRPVLFFPTRAARFYDYENWGVIGAIQDRIEAGELQIFCVDSVDAESFYSETATPEQRIERHIQYERYIRDEVIPIIAIKSKNDLIISAGCSMGAYHAANIAFKYPRLFSKMVGMSGRYDVTHQTGNFRDLLDGFNNEDVYFNMPSQYIGNLTDSFILDQLRQLEIIFAIGETDAFYSNNQDIHQKLLDRDVPNTLIVWDDEAHRPRHWRRMVQLYL